MCIHVCTSTSSKGMLKNIISKAGTEGLSGIERYTSCTSTSYLKQPMLYVQSVVEYYTNCTLLICQTSSCHLRRVARSSHQVMMWLLAPTCLTMASMLRFASLRWFQSNPASANW